MDFGLMDRVAVVTGAASGIGEACAMALAAEGCRVVVSDIREEGIRRLEQRQPDVYSAVLADLASDDGPAAVIEHASNHFGRVDVIVTAGGVFGRARGGLFAGTEGASVISREAWDHTLAVNLRGSFLVAQAAIPHMARARWGRVIAIGSVSGQMGGFGAGADYASSKAAIGGMVRSLALTAGPLGITVNAVNPGMIQTPMLTANHDTSVTRVVVERSAMRRLGTREEVAATIVMLASEQAGFITGAHLDINGGFYFA